MEHEGLYTEDVNCTSHLCKKQHHQIKNEHHLIPPPPQITIHWSESLMTAQQHQSSLLELDKPNWTLPYSPNVANVGEETPVLPPKRLLQHSNNERLMDIHNLYVDYKNGLNNDSANAHQTHAAMARQSTSTLELLQVRALALSFRLR